MDRDHADVVIVGGGIAGILVAARMIDAGHDVILLEAGAEASGEDEKGWQAYLAHFHANPAKTPNSPYPVNPAARSPSVLDVAKIDGAPSAKGYFVQRGPDPFRSNYLRALGGTTLHWLGTCLRMTPADFEMQSRYRQCIDWPFGYDVLAPYYERAEWEIGVSGDVAEQGYHGIGFAPGYQYPMQPVPATWSDRKLEEAIDGMTYPVGDEEVGVGVSNTPVGRNSLPRSGGAEVAGSPHEALVPHGGSAAYVFRGQRCEGNSSCIPICPVQAKYSALRTLREIMRDPERRDRLTVKKQCVVSCVEFDAESGRVGSVVYKRYSAPDRPRDFEVHRVSGRIVVLAANAVENAKIGLASGLRDESGQLGGNLMDHPFILTWGRASEPVGPFRGPGATSGIESFRDGGFRRERASFRVEIGNWGWNLATGAPASDVSRLARENGLRGADLRRRLRHDVQRQVRLGALVEQPPDARNRVSISEDWRDEMGEYRPVIDYRINDYTKAGIALARAACHAVLVRAGIEDLTHFSEDAPGWVEHEGEGYTYYGSGHLVGTHRIGSTSKIGPTDPDMRSWHHPNLWMVGAGAMPTIATSNPTLTLSALTLKAADAMLAALKDLP